MGMEKAEALAERGSGPPWTGETDDEGREPCGEPEGVEGMTCPRELSQEAFKKGGKEELIRDPTCFRSLPRALISVVPTAKHITQNRPVSQVLVPHSFSASRNQIP